MGWILGIKQGADYNGYQTYSFTFKIENFLSAQDK